MDDIRDRLVRKGDYVYGSFIRPEAVDGYINGVNPGDRSDILGRFCFSEASVDDAVEHARVAARLWRRVGLNDRAATVRRFRGAIGRFRERVVGLITRETGKPMWQARREVIETLKMLDHVLDAGLACLAPNVVESIAGRNDAIPRGVVALLCPFNYPCLIPATHSATALLAGNTVVYKPSKFAPGVGQLIAELWDQCKLPRGVVNMVQGSGSGVGKRLITHNAIDALVVAGGFNTAMDVRRQVFERPELPVLYLSGGKGVALVFEGGEVDRAVYEVMTGAFLSTGQRHDNTARAIVHAAVWDEFVDKLVTQTQRLRLGYGFDNAVFMGPLISENSRSRFRRYGRAVASKGHDVLLEGVSRTKLSRRGFYVTPAIYNVNWRGGSAFLNEEPPGPTLLLYKVDSTDEAIALHNQARYRLACSLFPKPGDSGLPDIVDRLRTGSLFLNRSTTHSILPLEAVGLGRSSNGWAGGLGLLRVLTYPRSQVAETQAFDASHALPGTFWNDEEPTADLPAIEVEAEMDVSAMLEPI